MALTWCRCGGGSVSLTPAQLVASRNETLRQMTVTLLGLSDESLNAVLNLACRLRTLEGLPSPD